MLGAKLSSIAASAVLLLSSGAIAMAQSGTAQDLPEEVQNLQLVNETSTNLVVQDETTDTVDDGGEGSAFSEWVESFDPEGPPCLRGLTIAATAQAGPTDFTGPVTPDPDHPALQRCGSEDETTVEGASQGNRPQGVGSQGRQRAEGSDVSSSDAGTAGDDDAGPPPHAGPPSHSGAPDHAGPPNGR